MVNQPVEIQFIYFDVRFENSMNSITDQLLLFKCVHNVCISTIL